MNQNFFFFIFLFKFSDEDGGGVSFDDTPYYQYPLFFFLDGYLIRMGDESRETGRRAAGRGGAKKRMRSKSAKRATKLSPLQERLKDTDCYLNHEMERILSAPTTKVNKGTDYSPHTQVSNSYIFTT